jgi:hypothetical protein
VTMTVDLPSDITTIGSSSTSLPYTAQPIPMTTTTVTGVFGPAGVGAGCRPATEVRISEQSSRLAIRSPPNAMIA